MIVRLAAGHQHARRAPACSRSSAVACPPSVSNTTADFDRPAGERPSRSTTARARSRSASEISQWRAVIVVCMASPPGSGEARAGDDVVEMALRVGRGPLPGEPSAKRRAPAPSAATSAGAAASSSIRAASAVDVAVRHQIAGLAVAHRVAQARAVRRDRRRAARGGLDDRDAPAFLGRREHVGPRARRSSSQLLRLADEAVERARVAQAEPTREPLELGAVVAGARDVERQVRPRAAGPAASARIARSIPL